MIYTEFSPGKEEKKIEIAKGYAEAKYSGAKNEEKPTTIFGDQKKNIN